MPMNTSAGSLDNRFECHVIRYGLKDLHGLILHKQAPDPCNDMLEQVHIVISFVPRYLHVAGDLIFAFSAIASSLCTTLQIDPSVS